MSQFKQARAATSSWNGSHGIDKYLPNALTGVGNRKTRSMKHISPSFNTYNDDKGNRHKVLQMRYYNVDNFNTTIINLTF